MPTEREKGIFPSRAEHTTAVIPRGDLLLKDNKQFSNVIAPGISDRLPLEKERVGDNPNYSLQQMIHTVLKQEFSTHQLFILYREKTLLKKNPSVTKETLKCTETTIFFITFKLLLTHFK